MEKFGRLSVERSVVGPAVHLQTIRLGILFVLSSMMALFAQTSRFLPDSTDAATLWRITPSTELFAGASFYYMNPDDSIIVWCDTSASDKAGNLYVMVPGFRDSALFLFTNRQKGVRINVTKLFGAPVPVRTEIFFQYRFQPDTLKPEWLRRYTGQNRVGIDPKDKVNYPGANFVTRDFRPNPGFGHRWAVAGRVRDRSGVPNDTLVFGFEDDCIHIPGDPDSVMIADNDFDDVIFRVTGLRLNVELVPDSIVLNVASSSRAGDTVRCTAAVWSDSGGTRIRTPQFDSLLRWQLIGAGVNRDTLMGSATNDTAFFLGRTSGNVCTIRAWLVSPVTGETVAVRRTILVSAGLPATLSIELRTDTAATTFNRNRPPPPLDEIMIASNQLSRSVYALLRDRFGNFAGFSQATKWDTLTTPGQQGGVATVASGNRLRGEGVVSKAVGSGKMCVAARDTAVAGIPGDTIIVNIAGASYDSLRVMVKTGIDTIAVGTLRMSTDLCTTLYVQGRRMDNKKWESVDVQWDFPDLWNSFDASTPQSRLAFCPADTGKGVLTVLQTAFLKQTITIQVVAGVPARLVLFRKDMPLPSDTVLSAGRQIDAAVRLFDRRGVWVSEVSLLSTTPIDWKMAEGVPVNDTLDSTGSIISRFYFDMVYLPLKAHRSVRVVATWGTLSDTCRLTIVPGSAYRVVIEPVADWMRSPNRVNPVDTIDIPDTRTSTEVFALLRDSLGNYVDSLRAGTWTSVDTIVSVVSGTPACRGSVIKNLAVREGLTRISVTAAEKGFVDTAWVRLLPFHFVKLRIASTAGPIDSLVCSTNDDTTLVVQGLRSDTALWRDVEGTWSVSPSVTLSANPPAGVSRFSFAPQKSAVGWIAAERTVELLYDTLPVRFVRGKPLRASIQLLTPAEKRCAGDTLIAVVKIFNRAGLVEGSYCFSGDSSTGPAYYLDSLGDGGRKAKPRVIIDNAEVPIVTPAHIGNGGRQCFINGEDTIGIVLYYAPAAEDSFHRIRFLAGGLTAATTTFRLLPGPLAALAVVHNKAFSPSDTLYLQAPRELAILSTIGADAFGNTRGEIVSRWKVSGNLHPVDSAGPLSRIKYTSKEVLDDQNGRVHAVSTADTAIGGTLQVVIHAPFATVESAITRDANGNGLLDAIDLTFSLPVVVRDAQSVRRMLTITAGATSFVVGRVTQGSTATNIRIYLDEQATSAPQTAWTPVVKLDNRSYALDGAVDTFTITCSDGAGPVIWSVTKELISADSRNLDRVTVVFSEKIFGPTGQPLLLAQPVDGIFNVWTKTDVGYASVALLDGISQFNEQPDPDMLVFVMSNAYDLTNLHYFSICVDSVDETRVPLIDATGENRPIPANQKVRVVVTGSNTGNLQVAPNPMRSTARREAPGTFNLKNNLAAKDWVRHDGAGTVLQFKIALPNEKGASIAGKVTIFDFAGNRVAADPVSVVNPQGLFDDEGELFENIIREKIIPASWSADGSVYEYCIYWNGYSLDGNPVAPGVYRVVLTLDMSTSKGKETRRLTELIGVRR